MSALRIGRVVEGGKVHLSTSRCPVLTNRPIALPANPAKVTSASVCRWCAKPANLAAAHRENTTGTNWSAAVEKILAAIGPQTTVAQILNRPGRGAELAAIAAAHAAVLAPVEVETVPEPVEPVKPSFASVLADLGGRHNGAHYDHAARRLARRNLANAA